MGLRVYIYKNPTFKGCSNKGISEQVDELTLVNVNGPSDPTPDAPAALLLKNHGMTARVVPAIEVGEGRYAALNRTDACGPMMGGSFVNSSDSRFGEAVRAITHDSFYGAVAFHDRFETSDDQRMRPKKD